MKEKRTKVIRISLTEEESEDLEYALRLLSPPSHGERRHLLRLALTEFAAAIQRLPRKKNTHPLPGEEPDVAVHWRPFALQMVLKRQLNDGDEDVPPRNIIGFSE